MVPVTPAFHDSFRCFSFSISHTWSGWSHVQVVALRCHEQSTCVLHVFELFQRRFSNDCVFRNHYRWHRNQESSPEKFQAECLLTHMIQQTALHERHGETWEAQNAMWIILTLNCSYKMFFDSLHQSSTWVGTLGWAICADPRPFPFWDCLQSLDSVQFDCSDGSASCAWVLQFLRDKTFQVLSSSKTSRSLHLWQLFCVCLSRKQQGLQLPLPPHRHLRHHLLQAREFHVLPEKILPPEKEDHLVFFRHRWIMFYQSSSKHLSLCAVNSGYTRPHCFSNSLTLHDPTATGQNNSLLLIIQAWTMKQNHPFASSGKVTWHFLLQRSNSSVAREIHTFRDRLRQLSNWKPGWASHSSRHWHPSAETFIQQGKQLLLTIFNLVLTLALDVQHTLKLFRKQVYTYAPRALVDTLLSKVRSLFVTQTFHLLYSLPSLCVSRKHSRRSIGWTYGTSHCAHVTHASLLACGASGEAPLPVLKLKRYPNRMNFLVQPVGRLFSPRLRSKGSLRKRTCLPDM